MTPRDLWQEALSTLGDEDKAAIDVTNADKKAVLEDLLTAAEDKRQLCLQKRWKFKRKSGEVVILRDIFEKIVQWVRKFKDVGDIAVQYDPGHAALPWAAVRFLLQISINDVEMFGAMAENIESCSRRITACFIIENIYLDHASSTTDNLQAALVRLYASILTSLSATLRYFRSNTLGRAGRSLFVTAEDKASPLVGAIESDHAQVRHWCTLIDAERQKQLVQSTDTLDASIASTKAMFENISISVASRDANTVERLENLLHSLDVPLQRFIDSVNEVNDNLERNQRLEVLRWLSTIPYRQHHRNSMADVLKGSGAWLGDRAALKDWSQSSSSSTLWLHGIPGCGKTKLLSIVIESLLQNRTELSAPLAYFYCSRDPSETQRADPGEILRAILKQLSCKDSSKSIRPAIVREFEKRRLDAEEDGLEPSKLSIHLTIELILAITEEVPAVIVIDALDECQPTNRYELLNALERIQTQSSSVVKILVSSRDDADLKHRLEQGLNIEVSASDNADDVRRFVYHELNAAVQQYRLLSGQVSDELKEQLQKRLVDGSRGMFRWASLQIQTLCDPTRMKLESDVVEAMDRLPETLSELYVMILQQIRQAPRGAYSTAVFTLQWLLCAHVPLQVEQMIDLVSPPSRILFTDVLRPDDILSVCSNLVVLDRELNCFRFAHISVQDFLVAQKGFDHDAVHTMAASRCLDLYNVDPLDYSHFARGEIQGRPSFEYAACHLMTHYRAIKDRMRPLSLKRGLEDFFINGREIRPSFGHWMLYVAEAALQLDSYDPLMETLVSLVTLPPANPLFTACAFDLVELSEVLANVPEIDLFQRNVKSATILHVAARNGFADMINFLVMKGLDVNATTDSGETPLHLAAEFHHLSSAHVLLRHGAEVSIEDLEGWTALDRATKHKEADMIVLLVNNGAKSEACAKYGKVIESLNNDSPATLRKLRDYLSRPTGFIGIHNEGQTGFLNTNLQMMSMLKPFRQVIFRDCQACSDDQNIDVVVEFRNILEKLDDSREVVSTHRLTSALNWKYGELDKGQDPVEVRRVFINWLQQFPSGDVIQKACKGMIAQRYAPDIPDLEFEKIAIASHKSDFYQQGLNFHDSVISKIGDRVTRLPHILMIEIRRSYIDQKTQNFAKDHSSFPFPRILTFDEDLNLDPTENSPIRFILHGVLVHRGDIDGGRSYVFLKPRRSDDDGGRGGQWTKFRNEHVSFATDTEAVEDNFGYYADSDTTPSLPPPKKLRTSRTAQALMYLREEELGGLLYFG